MQNETVSRRYALAVFSLAQERGSLERVQGDLHGAVDALTKDDDVRRFFVSPVIERATKAQVVEEAFAATTDEIALHTLLLLVRKRREALLRPIVDEFDKLVLKSRDMQPLEIVSARPLAPGELDEMVARLGRAYGTAFQVTERTDPGLLGGVRITLGDKRVDGSLSGRLDDLTRDLGAHT